MVLTINNIAQFWWQWMGAMFWQVSLLIVLVSLLDLVVRKRVWPQVRYALWMLVVLKLLIPPTWSAPTSPIAKLQPWAKERIEIQWNKQFSAQENTAVKESGEAPTSLAAPFRAQREETGGIIPQVYAFAVWLVGVLLLVFLLFTRISKLRRWHREQEERQTIPEWFHRLMVKTADRLKLERLPAIVFHQEAVTPAVYGVFRPVLLLPARYLENLSREDAEHVLLHELAHLKRGDLLINGLVLLLQIVYWFNPLILYARKQMKHVREMCCDLTIANILREKTMKYRKTLLHTARELLTESLEPGMGLLGVFEEPFRLVARLKWLERKTWQFHKWTAPAVCCVLLVTIPILLPMAGAKVQPEGGELSAAQEEAAGDFYYKEVTHSDNYFLGLRTNSRMEAYLDMWLRNNIAVREAGDKRIIVDLDAQKFYFINHKTESYVEAPLPLDLSKLIDEDSWWRKSRPTFSGRVDKTEGSAKILNKQCDEYLVTFWQIDGDNRINFAEVKVWATTEVDYDLTALYRLLDIFRRLVKRDAAVRAELDEIKGVQMKVEFGVKRTLWSKKMIDEIVELKRTKAPDEVFSVPFGYLKKDKFSPEDLQF